MFQSFAGLAELGRGGVGVRRRRFGVWRGPARRRARVAVRNVDEVRGGVVAQQAARTQLDMRKAGRAVPASTSFAEVDDRLRSEASLAWTHAAYPFREVGSLSISQAMS